MLVGNNNNKDDNLLILSRISLNGNFVNTAHQVHITAVNRFSALCIFQILEFICLHICVMYM